MKFAPTEEKLKERVKELTCLFEISKLISRSENINEITLKKIISSIKKAWRFNKDATVEIQIEGYNLLTSKISKKSIFQISYIRGKDFKTGFIKVHYPAHMYTKKSFLKDEKKLLNNAAFEIANYIDKFKNIEKEARLIRTTERLGRLSILGEMTAGIAHELNTPLGNILGFAELIKEQNTNDEIDSDLEIVINSVIYCREIVKKLMFFSCEIPQQLKPEKIKPIITFVFSFLKQNFQQKNIKSELVFKNDDIIARVDSVQITQVLFNLLINAINASPEKSRIRTIVENDDNDLIITIEDHGVGIPDEIKQNIFEPFFTTKAMNEGLGLGLSVVHGIIKNHNGKISIKDNIPNGIIFTVQIPLS
jgi:signal transduction histidine kinase